MKQSLTELRVICSIWQWGKLPHQSRSLTPIRRNHSRKIETMPLKLVITQGLNPEHRGYSITASKRAPKRSDLAVPADMIAKTLHIMAEAVIIRTHHSKPRTVSSRLHIGSVVTVTIVLPQYISALASLLCHNSIACCSHHSTADTPPPPQTADE
jgi:hypothetical protein